MSRTVKKNPEFVCMSSLQTGKPSSWLKPITALATYTGFSPKQLRQLQELVETRKDEISDAWTSTSKPEIVVASEHGIWLVSDATQYSLPFQKFPWFEKQARANCVT